MARFLSHAPWPPSPAERFFTIFDANRPSRTEQLFRADDKMQMRQGHARVSVSSIPKNAAKSFVNQ
jgi:hypothetical protein